MNLSNIWNDILKKSDVALLLFFIFLNFLHWIWLDQKILQMNICRNQQSVTFGVTWIKHFCSTVLFIFHIFFKACGGSWALHWHHSWSQAQGLPAGGVYVLREGDIALTWDQPSSASGVRQRERGRPTDRTLPTVKGWPSVQPTHTLRWDQPAHT